MIDCLRQHLLYSEKRARDLLFQAIQSTLSDTGPLILTRLTREGANRARQEAENVGYEFTNSETVSKAVVRSMLFAGVLLGKEGDPIPPGIAAWGTEVAALEAEFEDITEAYLLEFLIRKLGDVTTRDHTPLAHALFRQFDRSVPIEDLKDRVLVLLARLADRVVLREDGGYAVRPSV
jgi:hypothetical protein